MSESGVNHLSLQVHLLNILEILVVMNECIIIYFLEGGKPPFTFPHPSSWTWGLYEELIKK